MFMKLNTQLFISQSPIVPISCLRFFIFYFQIFFLFSNMKEKNHEFFINHLINIFVGVCTASIALFTDLEIVFDMISISTLLVFYLVANALIYRRYVITTTNHPLPTLLFLFLLSTASLGFSLSWKLNQKYYWWGLATFGGFTIATTSFFHYMVHFHCRHLPPPPASKWSVPLMPWPAAASIFLNVFLMTSLKRLAFQRFGVWACLITLFYVLYGVHSTYQAEEVDDEVGGDIGINHTNSSTPQVTKVWYTSAFMNKKELCPSSYGIFLPCPRVVGGMNAP